MRALFLFARRGGGKRRSVLPIPAPDSAHVLPTRPRRFAAGSRVGKQNENAHCISIVLAPDRGNNGDN